MVRDISTERQVNEMTEERKEIIREIVNELKQMDPLSLELVKNNAELLKTRDKLEVARKAG